MYEGHFSLSATPFGPLGPGKEPFRSRAFAETAEALRSSRTPVTVLVGRRGAGKTTLLEHLASAPGPGITYGLLRAAASARGSIARRVLTAFAWPMPAGYGPEIGEALATGIAAEAAEGCAAVLLVDDAGALTTGEVETLGALTRGMDGGGTLRLILAGRPGDDEASGAPRVTFGILSADECIAYVRHRMAAANGDGIFSADALAMVHGLSGGIPAAIDRLCDLALTTAMATGRRDVDARLIQALIDANHSHPGFIEQTLRDLAGARGQHVVRLPAAAPGAPSRAGPQHGVIRAIPMETAGPARALYFADRSHMDAALAAVMDDPAADGGAGLPARPLVPIVTLPASPEEVETIPDDDDDTRAAPPSPKFSSLAGLTTAAAAAALAIAVISWTGETADPALAVAAPAVLGLPSTADAVAPALSPAREAPARLAAAHRSGPAGSEPGPDLEAFALYLNPRRLDSAMPSPRPYRLADGDTFQIRGRLMASLHLIEPAHRAAWPGVVPPEPRATPNPGTAPVRAEEPGALAEPLVLVDARAAAETGSATPALDRRLALLAAEGREARLASRTRAQPADASGEDAVARSAAPSAVAAPPSRPGYADIPVAELVSRAERLPAAAQGDTLRRNTKARAPSVSLALLSRIGAADWGASASRDPLATPTLDDIPLPPLTAEMLPLSNFAPDDPAPAAVDPAVRRLVIHHRAHNLGRARALLAPLRARGFRPELREVSHVVNRSHIRYFSTEDVENARLVSGIVSGHGGESTTLRDFAHYRPSPRRGTLELWLSD